MNRFLIALAFTLMMASTCHAAGTFICNTDSGVSFQAMPCPEGSNEGSALAPSARVEMPVDEDAVVVASVPAAGMAPGPVPVAAKPSRGHLQVGISDMQVLNNRHWGKPQHITRNREARAWHEYWTYEAGVNDAMELHFVNGKLVSFAGVASAASINDLQLPAPTGTLTPAVMLVESQPKS